MGDLDNLVGGLGSAINTVPELYTDAIQPAAQESGKTFALLPRTINALFAPLRHWIAEREHSVLEVEKILEIKLANVNPTKIVSPEPYIAVPAIHAISYSMDIIELRELYTNLLAKAMNTDTKNNVHPAFVEVIKQLSPIEARLLNIITYSRQLPFINIFITFVDGSKTLEVEGFTLYQEELHITSSEAIVCWNNLERLNIFRRAISSSMITDSDCYSDLINHPNVKTYLSNELPEGQSFSIQRNYFELTNFGAKFVETCIDSPKLK